MDHNLSFGTKLRVLHLKTEIYHRVSRCHTGLISTPVTVITTHNSEP